MFNWFKKKAEWTSPVGDVDKLDIIAKFANGRVDLLLVMVGLVDSSPRTLDAISQKLRNYCRYVMSDEFRAEFGEPNESFVTIGLRPTHQMSEDLMTLAEDVFAEENPPAELAIFYEYPGEANDPRPAPGRSR